MAYGDSFGGLGGSSGGGFNDFLTNPLLLASLQMISNNSPRIGQPVDTLHGVPQLLFSAGTKAKEEEAKRRAEAAKRAAESDVQRLFETMGGNTARNDEPPADTTEDTPASAPVEQPENEPDYTTPNETPDTSQAAPDAPDNRTIGGWENLPQSVIDGLGGKVSPGPTPPDEAPAEETPRPRSSYEPSAAESPANATQRALETYAANRTGQPAMQTLPQVGQAEGSAEPMPQRGPQTAALQPMPYQAPGAAPTGPTTQAALEAFAAAQAQQKLQDRAPQEPAPAREPLPVPAEGGTSTYAQNKPAPAPPQRVAQVQQAPVRAQPAQPAPPVAQRAQAADPKLFARVMANPYTPPAVKAQLMQQANPTYGFKALPDGTVLRTDPKTGKVDIAHQGGARQGAQRWQVIGQDMNGPVYGYPPTPEEYKAGAGTKAKADGDVEAIATKMTALREAGASQDEVIEKTLPKHLQGYMKALLRGDADPKNLGRVQGKTKENLLELAQVVDPNFKESQIALRQTFAKNMASSAPNSWGSQVRSAGTVVKHLKAGLDSLDVVAKGAKGIPGGEFGEQPELNRARALINRRGGDEAYNRAIGAYDVDADAVAGEVVRLLTGGPGSEKDRTEWKNKFDYTKNSISSVRGAWNEAYTIMHGRLEKIAEQKDAAYGTETNPLSLLGKGAEDLETRIRQQGAAPGSQGATRITDDDEGVKAYNALKPGTLYTDPNGKLKRKQ